jgi:hypothetical protein
MTQYIVDAADQTTETALVTYQAARGGVQSTVGQMYQAIQRAEDAYVMFESMLAEDGPLSALSAYHTAKQAPIADAVAGMRAQMGALMATMRAMQSAMPPGIVLFPGVPRNETGIAP